MVAQHCSTERLDVNGSDANLWNGNDELRLPCRRMPLSDSVQSG